MHPWYEVVAAGATKAAEELKVAGINVDVIWDSPPQADVADHNRRIETNIGRHPDGLAVSCLDPATNVQLLGEAAKAEVNVITFDTFCSEDFDFVGHKGDYQDGADLAEFLAEKIGDAGKVGILAGSLTATNHAARVKGFKETIAKHPNIEIVFEQPDDDNLEKAVSLTENALQANPDIKGFFGANASNPIGAARAVKNAGKAGEIVIVGMDDLPETLRLHQGRRHRRREGAAPVGDRLLDREVSGREEPEPHDPACPRHRLADPHQGPARQLIPTTGPARPTGRAAAFDGCHDCACSKFATSPRPSASSRRSPASR